MLEEWHRDLAGLSKRWDQIVADVKREPKRKRRRKQP
jgi:hypothetical protein